MNSDDDQNLEEYIEAVNSINSNIKLLESSMVRVVVDSSKKSEDVLKDLTAFLHASATELRQLSSQMSQIINISNIFNSTVIKLDNIENKTSEIPKYIEESSAKIVANIENQFKKNNDILIKLFGGMKRIIDNSNVRDVSLNQKIDKLQSDIVMMGVSVKTISKLTEKSQESMNDLVKKLIDSNVDIARSSADTMNQEKVEETKSKRDTIKAKSDLRTKVILSVISSGGLLFFILEMIFKLLGRE